MPLQPDPEARRAAACRRLGSDHPVCISCGEEDPFTLELHHIAGRAHDALAAPICRNCHRTLTDPTDNAKSPTEVPLMERVGHLLVGLAVILQLLVRTLRSHAAQLLAGAQVCPWPYGWVGAPAAS
jgi:hypothetical protein